jgi:serine protease Do
MTGSRRVWRTTVAVALAILGTAMADGRVLAQDQASSLSASFRRAALRAKGALVSVRVPDGFRAGAPYVPTRPGRFGPAPIMPPFVDRTADADGRVASTGVVIDADKGYILAADHPTEGASQLIVTFPDGNERPTSQIRRDPRSDLALLVVDMQGLHPGQVNWGDPARLEPGDWLIALGQPGIGDPTMSVGVYSTRRRGDGEVLLETDAAISRIGAGGVLVNLNGDVVGIGKRAGRRADGFEGMGHAIPADRARRIAADLAQFGQVRRAYLGITVAPAEPAMPGRGGSPPRVRVASVGIGTPAAEAGVRPGDLILTVGSRPVDSMGGVQEAVELAPIGEELTLTIERQGQRIEIKVRTRAVPMPMGTSTSPRSNPYVETRRDGQRGGAIVPPGPGSPGGGIGPGPLPPLVPPDGPPGPPEP